MLPVWGLGVAIERLSQVDFSVWAEPDPHLEPREFLEAWLRYQRLEFVRKLRDLRPNQIVARSIPPVEGFGAWSGSTHDPDGARLAVGRSWWR